MEKLNELAAIIVQFADMFQALAAKQTRYKRECIANYSQSPRTSPE